MTKLNGKMKVQIWGDFSCPYCYIAKSRFDDALDRFAEADRIDIVWRSFEIAPSITTVLGKTIYQHLTEHGMTIDQAKAGGAHLTSLAMEAGLDLNFDRIIPANSFRAHRLSHMAKQHGLQEEAEEALFYAYFVDGQNIDDIPTLILLAERFGLSAAETKTIADSDLYAAEVRQDIVAAGEYHITAVPAYVFNGVHVLKGLQDSNSFLATLEKSFDEWRTEGSSCALGEGCLQE